MKKNRKLASLGLVAGLVAGAGAGFVLEMSGSAGASDASVAVVQPSADDDGTDVSRPDPAARLQEVLQPLIDDGTLTQEQVDKVIATLEAARPERGEGPRGGPGGPRGRGHRGEHVELLTTTLGVTAEELREGLQDGKTLAEIAVENGKTAQDVIDALVADVKSHLDQAVTNGRLTQEQADAKLAEATERITDRVNNGRPERPADAPAGDDSGS